MVPKVVVQLVEELKEVMTVSEVCLHLGVAVLRTIVDVKQLIRTRKKKNETNKLAICVKRINFVMAIE